MRLALSWSLPSKVIVALQLDIGGPANREPTNQRTCVCDRGFLVCKIGGFMMQVTHCSYFMIGLIWSSRCLFASYFDSNQDQLPHQIWPKCCLTQTTSFLWMNKALNVNLFCRKKGIKKKRPKMKEAFLLVSIVYQLRSSSCTKKTEGFQQFFPFKPSTFFTKIWGSESDFVRFFQAKSFGVNPKELNALLEGDD